jgi:cytochrome b subunit of formate dehydrogenase
MEDSTKMNKEKAEMHTDVKIPRRFTLSQQIEHSVLAVSFILLSITGLAQKFAWNSIADQTIYLLGGITMTRLIHRISAFVFTVQSIYHFVIVDYRIYVYRIKMTMLPSLKDVADAWHSIRHSLFMTKHPPNMPRYNFGEKLEYWALIWGGIIMMGTGFMLWNPVFTTKFLPGEFIPAAKAAHGGEAVLAVLSIIVWHFYNVHIRTFNKSMFTGKLTRHQMEEEHGAEWNELLEAKAVPLPPAAVIRRRKLVFMPIAILTLVGGIGIVWWAATAENTAIETLPEPTSRPAIYNPPSTSGALISQTGVSAPLIPHPIRGQEQCLMCHGKSGMKPVGSSHKGRPLDSCLICHRERPVLTTPKSAARKKSAGSPNPVPHPVEGDPYRNCLICHGFGKVKPFPANHAHATIGNCTACHRSGAKQKTEADSTNKTAVSSGPKPVPHPVDADPYEVCANCHAIGKIMPFPQNHATFPAASCTACHKAGAKSPGEAVSAKDPATNGGPKPETNPTDAEP